LYTPDRYISVTHCFKERNIKNELRAYRHAQPIPELSYVQQVNLYRPADRVLFCSASRAGKDLPQDKPAQAGVNGEPEKAVTAEIPVAEQ